MEGPFKKAKKASINGLTLIKDFLSDAEEAELLRQIDASEWNTSLKRRTQHYGYEYNYTTKDASKPAPPIPEWCHFVIDRLNLPERPDQMIVNEYCAGQGIAAHIDNTSFFGDTVVSVSLGASIVMDFSRTQEKVPVTLPRKSAVILKDEARYKWFHGISASAVKKGMRRVSLTFRKIKKKT